MTASLKQPLTNAQLEILALFSENLSEQDMKDLHQWLLEFRYRRLQNTLNQLADEKGWTEKTFEEWGKAYLRTPYKSQQQHLKNIAGEGGH